MSFRHAIVLCLAAFAAAPSAPQWADRLDDADLAVAGRAAEELGQLGASAFPAIRALLDGGTAQQRWGATVALYRSTADPETFLPVLTRQLSAEDVRLVLATLGTLARLESRAAPALPGLKALLK